jgi:hypothetical protein
MNGHPMMIGPGLTLRFGLDLRRGEWSGGMEQGIRGGIRSGTPRRKSRRKPKGCRDERAFWRLERTEAGGVRDARCLWKEPKHALVAAGKIEAAFAVLDNHAAAWAGLPFSIAIGQSISFTDSICS